MDAPAKKNSLKIILQFSHLKSKYTTYSYFVETLVSTTRDFEAVLDGNVKEINASLVRVFIL